MRVANTLKVIGAVLCVAGCGAEPAHSEQAEHAHSEAAGQTSSAGSSAQPAAKPASENSAPAQSSAPKAGNGAPVAPAAGAQSAPKPGAQAGASGSAAGQGAAAGSGGSTAAAGSSAAGSGAATPVATEKFSFFVTSLQGMRDLSKSENGFGGDLRYGQKTGLEGADKICTELAERSMPGAGGKGWHAFLSAAKSGENGGPVHAKDRIGKGPWYDRPGRLVAMTLEDLLKERPAGADPAIIDDLPNERGEPNHTDTVPEMDDNHDVVTATNAQGMWDGKTTCEDWTSTETPMAMMEPEPMMMMGPWGNIPDDGPGLGHSWPSEFSGVSWMTVHRAPGCGASVALVQTGAGMGTGIGNAGGYGGIYCFAMMP